ncbi:hypothetical protein DERF_007895 [Dermatophagoides farinae]|uniref:RDRP core domain-containing protein n=1 Tax=Dermatophagoides farinae TaxID=6954 RepID=A0A922L447_DERFA|nr:hypothetical protein DERF_007895 [Dermatophagoides farinae]
MNDEVSEKACNDHDSSSSSSSLLSKPFTVTITKLRNIITSVDSDRCCHHNNNNEENNVDDELKQAIKLIHKKLTSDDNHNNKRYIYDINKHHFYNDFVIKFDIDFYLCDPMENFLSIFMDFNRQQYDGGGGGGGENQDDNSKIFFEFSLNSLNRLWQDVVQLQQQQQQQMEVGRMMADKHFECRLKSISIGSLINVNAFVNRLQMSMVTNNTNNNIVTSTTNKLLDGQKMNHQTINCPQMEMDFYKKILILYFHVNKKNILYRLEISFSSIKLIMIESIMDRFYLELNASPFLFLTRSSTMINNNNNLMRNQSQTPTTSTMTMTKIRYNWERIRNLQASFINYKDAHLIGYAISYRIQLLKESLMTTNIINELIRLGYICKDLNRNFTFLIIAGGGCSGASNGIVQQQQQQQKQQQQQIIKSIHIDSINSRYSMNTLTKMIDERFANKNYAILYACRVLFSKSYKIIDSLLSKNETMIIFDTIERLLTEDVDPTIIEECLYSLDAKYKMNMIIDLKWEFEKIVQLCQQRYTMIRKIDRGGCKSPSMPSNDDHVMMRSATMTPTRLEFSRPMPLLRSRFSNIANLDYALRLTLAEDNNRKLNGTFSDTNFIKASIKPRLLAGIRVGDRFYQFLGSSSSQMRENGIVFYACDDQQRTAQSIRALVGNLSNFKRKVAKYIARFGLVFSQAIAYYHYGETAKVCKMDDLKTANNEFCFSDGIGIMSNNIAAKINPLLRLPRGYLPSAYQIRHGGCKGMLVCYPTANREGKDVILFRDSMIKYESDDDCLGILKFSAPRSVWLNRPLINILDQQWVPAPVFYEIFTASTGFIMKALLFDRDAFRLVSVYRNSNLPYQRLFQAGFSFLREPFLRRILKYLLFYRLNELKCKARIAVPESNGRMAFGVIDETHRLNCGEIFFQYSVLDFNGNPIPGRTIILENQEVMVTKFPCLSLGDVRKFRAVNVPSLTHIKDCLVFPAKGPRPHTDEMGGSDLDGDEYAIFWQTELIFPGGNYRPMDFVNHTPDELNHDINLDDIVTFYCDYLLENNIGQVANCHLMYSDFHPKGLRSNECDELARKYSISLDFQKNGINSQLQRKYQPDSRWIRPDFMEKRIHCKSYLSEKILGQFYRHCSLIETMIRVWDDNQQQYKNHNESPDKRLILTGWKQYESEANEAYLEYHHKLIETMEMMLIESESALMSNVYDDKNDVSPYIFDQLFRYFQNKFESQYQMLINRHRVNDEDQADQIRLLLISAWYTICYENCHKIQYQYRGKSLLGLPFMVPNEMIRLANNVEHLMLIPKSSKPPPPPMLRNHLEHSSSIIMMKNVQILIIKWIERMNRIIFNQTSSMERPSLSSQMLRLYNNELNCWEEKISEDMIISNLIREKLEKIIIQHDSNKLYTDQKSRHHHHHHQWTMFTLFQEFMLHLYEQCNQIEWIVHRKQFKELLLIRYGLFSLNFFMDSGDMMIIDDGDGNLIIPKNSTANDDSIPNSGDGDDDLDDSWKMNEIFDEYLNRLFRGLENQTHTGATADADDDDDDDDDDDGDDTNNCHQFCILENSNNNNNKTTKNGILQEMDEKFFLKLKFLTGGMLKNMKIYDQNDHCLYATDSLGMMKKRTAKMPTMNNNHRSNVNRNIDNNHLTMTNTKTFFGYNLKRFNISYLTIEIVTQSSTKLDEFQTAQIIITFLRLLLGHPKFFPNIYNQFDLIIDDCQQPQPQQQQQQQQQTATKQQQQQSKFIRPKIFRNNRNKQQQQQP